MNLLQRYSKLKKYKQVPDRRPYIEVVEIIKEILAIPEVKPEVKSPIKPEAKEEKKISK